MNLSDEIRKQIEKNKGLKLAVGEINNHLSILEGLVRKDIEERVDEAYQRGLDDAWECMKSIAFLNKPRDMRDFFGCSTIGGVLIDYSAKEAIEKLKAYEEKQKADGEIKVGDEVIYNEHKFIVFALETEERYASLFDVNGRHASADHRECKKTGRHFDIDKILEEMKE